MSDISRKHRPALKRRRVLALAAIALAISGAVTYLRLRAADPEVAARSALLALMDRSADRYFEYRVPAEEALGPDRQKFRAVWRELIEPRLARARWGRDMTSTRLNDPATQGTAQVPLRLPDGTEFLWGVVTWTTDQGPKIPVMWDTLSMAWVLDYAVDNPQAYRERRPFAEAKLAGLRRDRRRLEELGIRGMVAGNGYFLTWDQVERAWTRQSELAGKARQP